MNVWWTKYLPDNLREWLNEDYMAEHYRFK
jgi:hypothetical protein